MADYYPLIAKAVAGLDKSTGETRRALYDRARTALLAQLRGVEPALSEPDITRERLALEEAIRKVESEVAFQRVPDAARRSRLEQPADAQDDGEQAGYDRTESEETRHAVPLSAAATARAADSEARRGERWSSGGPSLSDNGLRSFREGLGEAGPANDGGVRANPVTDRDFKRLEQSAGYLAEAAEGPGGPEHPLPRLSSRDGPRSLAPVAEQNNDARGRALQSFPRVVRQEPRALTPERERIAPGRPLASTWNAPRNTNRIVAIAVIALMAAGIGGVALWFGDDIMGSMRGRTADATAMVDSGARGTKYPERAPSLGGAAENALAPQKVVLYEEDPYNPNGAQFVGTAIWRTERVPPAAGKKPEVVIRGEIKIPEQKVSVNLTLSRNDDKQLPASHTVEIRFELPPEFSHGGIASIPGIMVKQGETNRGIALNGIAVKVVDNYFLVGLSLADGEMQRNIQLLKERSWFDIPIVYGDGKRALIAIEKGQPGERAFAEAFTAWDQP
jgi:hypothetical protein